MTIITNNVVFWKRIRLGRVLINALRQTVRALDLMVPSSLLAIADEVIEITPAAGRGGLMRRRDFITAFGRAATLPLLWPLAAQSEQSTKPYRLAYLALLPGENSTFARSFLHRLEELGYREGQNMIWDYPVRRRPGRTVAATGGRRCRRATGRADHRIWNACSKSGSALS